MLFRLISLKHLHLSPLRTGLTMLGVAFGVALYVAIQIINRSTTTSFRESINAVAGKSTLSIDAGEAGFPEEVMEKVRLFPGVRHAVPLVEARAYLAGDKDSADSLVILGVDLLKESSVRSYKTTNEDVIDDPLVFLNQPDSIIVTHAFAQSHHLDSDSKFLVATAQGTMQLTVRGMLTPEGPAKAYGGSLAIMDIDGARAMFGKVGKLDRIDIVTRESANVDDVAKGLRALLGTGYNIDRPESRSDQLERMVSSFQAMLDFFSILALIVGVFLVANSVSISVAERRKEIGTLRALGSTRRTVVRMFFLESLAIGVLGSIVGTLLGRVLASFLVAKVGQAMIAQFGMRSDINEIVFGWREVALGIGVGTLISAVASYFPSRRAALVSPIEAMKPPASHSIDGSGSETWWRDRAALLGAALFGFSFTTQYFPQSLHSTALQVLSQFTGMLGVTLFAPLPVGLGVRVLRLALQALTTNRGGGVSARLAADNLLRNPTRTSNNIRSLTVGLVLVIVIASISHSFKTTIGAWLNVVLKSDLIVSSQGKLQRYLVQPLEEDFGREIARVPGVLAKGDTVFGMRFIKIQYQGVTLGLKAYDRPDFGSNYDLFDLQDRTTADAGPDLYDAKDPTCFVSNNFVHGFGKKTGDSIELSTPSGPVNFRIVGVVNDFAVAEGVIYVSRDRFKQLWNDRLITLFAISVTPGTDPETVRRAIDGKWARSKNIQALANDELRAQLGESIDSGFAFTWAIQVAALSIALMGLFNTLLISILERTRELGMMRAIGMTKRQLITMILGETTILGALGSVTAVSIGSALAYFFVTNTFEEILGWIIRFDLPLRSAINTAAFGTIIAVIATVYPCYRAVRVQIREALEYE